MEILLNFVWGAVALLIACLWLRSEPSAGCGRRRQLLAMFVLIAILFPVISVSDDLVALQTATEVDSCPRRDHLVPTGADPGFQAPALLSFLFVAAITSGPVTYASPTDQHVPNPVSPDATPIQNRPPPSV